MLRDRPRFQNVVVRTLCDYDGMALRDPWMSIAEIMAARTDHINGLWQFITSGEAATISVLDVTGFSLLGGSKGARRGENDPGGDHPTSLASGAYALDFAMT